MRTYYLPIPILTPAEGFIDVQIGESELVARKWQVSTFDLATLQTRHRLHLPYQLMDVLLGMCNLELVVSAETIEDAKARAHRLRAMLYLAGVTPFPLPFIATHSINEYAGINSRDSELLKAQLPEGLQDGVTTAADTVEVWPLELVLQVLHAGVREISGDVFGRAVTAAHTWHELVKKHKVLGAIQDVLLAAPLIVERPQALLHVWTGLEALFPQVNQELTFRIALYLAQLCKADSERRTLFTRVQKAYGVRSKVAHGALRQVSMEQWAEAWGLLRAASKAILNRGGLPTEEDLLKELLT